MINDIINKIRNGSNLADHEREYLDHVIATPTHSDYVTIYLAGLV